MLLQVYEKYPSWAKVFFDDDYEKQELAKMLTVKVPNARFSTAYRMKKWDGTYCFLNRTSNTIPIGFFDKVRVKFDAKVVDGRKYPQVKFHVPQMNVHQWRDYQKDALLHAFQNRCCLIHAATNAGKSYVIAGLIKMLYPESTTVLIHRQEILEQLVIGIYNWTGILPSWITAQGEIGDRVKELIRRKKLEPDPHVRVGMIMTVHKHVGEEDEEGMRFKYSSVLILDEVHHAGSATYRRVLARSKAVYRFGFSGTIPEGDTYEGMMVRQYIGDVVYHISNKDLIDLEVSARPTVITRKFFHNINYTRMREEITATPQAQALHGYDQSRHISRVMYQQTQTEHVVRNEARNRMVVEYVVKNSASKQILVVVDYIEHGEILIKMLREENEGEKVVRFIHGTASTRAGDLRLFNDGDLRTLISSSIIDEGIDISRIGMLILAGGKKSRRQILQRIGRALRRKTGANVVTVVDFYDMDNDGFLERHSALRQKIYRREQFEVMMLGGK